MPQDIVKALFANILPWIFLFGLLSILGTVFKLFFLPKIKGWFGEACINFWIRRRLDQETYHLIPDVMLPTPDGTTQIDHVIVSRYGIFVLETKNYKGWIFGSEKDAKWTQQIYKRKERFQNPLRQNYKHIKTMSDLTGIPMEYFRSVIVFVGEATFRTDMPDNVVHVHDFIRHIKSYAAPMIKDEQVCEIVGTIQEWAGTLTEEQKKSHVKNLRRNRAPVSSESSVPVCPRCGETMVLRTSRRDNSQFWGCPGYPKCRGTRKAA